MCSSDLVLRPLPREPLEPIGEPLRPVPDGLDPREELQRQIEEFLKNAAEGRRPKPPAAPRREDRERKRIEPAVAKPAAAPPLPPLAPAAERHVGSLESRPTEVARHVQDAFAHDLGHLAPGIAAAARRTEAAKPGATTAESLVTAARNPATIRQAILLREILERPVDRW